MPSVAETPFPISPSSSKKRRRDDTSFSYGDESQVKLLSPTDIFQDRLMSMEMEIMKHDTRRLLNPKRKLHDSKRQRVSPPSFDDSSPLQPSPTSHNTQDQRATWQRPLFSHSTSLPNIDFAIQKPSIGKADLSACHICRRKPTLKRELEDFLDCESCGNRTCAVCIRECLGLGSASEECSDNRIEYEGKYGQRVNVGEVGKEQGHKGLVCSKCCVERGPDGDVWCLGCLKAEQKG